MPEPINGHRVDRGAERDLRDKPCPRGTWCILVEGHTGPCHEVPRAKRPPPNYGPKR